MCYVNSRESREELPTKSRWQKFCTNEQKIHLATLQLGWLSFEFLLQWDAVQFLISHNTKWLSLVLALTGTCLFLSWLRPSLALLSAAPSHMRWPIPHWAYNLSQCRRNGGEQGKVMCPRLYSYSVMTLGIVLTPWHQVWGIMLPTVVSVLYLKTSVQ